MTPSHDQNRVAVIGAGFCGLGVAAALRRHGFSLDIFESDTALGGNWRHGVYDSVRLISTKRTTAFPDLAMPTSFPTFPDAAQVLSYLQQYAKHHRLDRRIRFDSRVVAVQPLKGGWSVQLADGTRRRYAAVVVATGHHWKRRFPPISGRFAGTYLHAKEYRSAEVFRNRRVLIIGGGNSACDLAVAASKVASEVSLSLRRGYWFMPRTFWGLPAVSIINPVLPVRLQRLVLRALIGITQGRYTDYGLQKPDHRIFDRHPVMNSELMPLIRAGRIKPRGEVQAFDGAHVRFNHGNEGPFDVVVAATGYEIALPMLSADTVPLSDGVPELIDGVFPLRHKGLYVFGLSQPRYGAGPVIHAGAELLCRIMKMQPRLTLPFGELLRRLGRRVPTSWLRDPHASMRGMRLAQLILPVLPFVERSFARHLARHRRAMRPRRMQGPRALRSP